MTELTDTYNEIDKVYKENSLNRQAVIVGGT